MRSSDLASQLKAVIDTVVDGIITIDAGGVIQSFNPAAERIFGYRATEVIGTNISALTPEPHRSRHDAYLQRYLTTGERRIIGFGREVEGVRKDGSRFPLELSVSEMSVGGERMFTGITRDVSERKRAEEALRGLSERLSLATAAASVGIWDWDVATGTLTWDDQMVRLHGIARDGFTGTLGSWEEKLHPEDLERVRAEVARSLRGEKDFDTEFRVVSPDRSVRHIKARAVVRRDSAGTPQRMVGTNWDITSVKAAEAALAAKNQELEAAARFDRLGARVMLALNQRHATAAPGAEVLRVLAEEACYRPLAFYEYDEWRGGLVLGASLGLGSGHDGRTFRIGEGLVGESAERRAPLFLDGAVGAELSLDTGVGVIQAATVFALPLFHLEKLLGVLTGAASTRLLDRERSRLAQVADQIAIGLYAARQFEELRLLTEQLNDRSRKIEAQNRELGRASRLKSEFLASMSHELRTPLNAIIGFSEVLKDGLLGELGPEQLDYVTEIFQSGRHLLSLINDILDLSKIEAGKMELELETVDLEALVGNGLTIMKERAARGRVTMTGSVAPGLGAIEADGRKLRQIVYNLLSNAVKFTPAGGTVRLDVTSTSHDRELQVSVADTGIGISPGDQERLFRPFEQLDGGIDRKFEGTGLGLVMVKSLAELHGGTVGVESELGKGSRFWVRLPRPGPVRSGGASLDPPQRRPVSSSPHVLVVDDDPAAISLARRWLEKDGYTVTGVQTCEAAWMAIQDRRPDVVLLDILFERGTGGWEFLAQLRNVPELVHLPVLIVSIVADHQRGLALGAVEVLQKPVAGTELVRAVESLGLNPARPGEPVHVLVVDDDPRAVEHVSRRLEQQGVLVSRAYGGREALAAIAAGTFQAVVLDLMMPDVSGFDVVRELRAAPETADLPVIVLTAKVLEESERRALEKSVGSVILKEEWNVTRFLHSVRGAIQAASRRSPSYGTRVADATAHPHRAVPAPANPPRILVVDDDVDARDLLRLYLEDAGFAVSLAASAEEALVQLDGVRPDLITLDLNLPGMNGLDFLAGLARCEPARGLPVLVVSGADAPGKALAIGAQAVLAKPIRRKELLSVVGQILGDTEGRRPHVLVVDDDPSAARVISSYLGAAADVQCVLGGQEALDVICTRRPDLVILDLMMPGVNGFDVLVELRSRAQTVDLPVVILSAKELTAAERAALSRNVQAVLEKGTTSQSDLLDQVRTLLRRARPETGGAGGGR